MKILLLLSLLFLSTEAQARYIYNPFIEDLDNVGDVSDISVSDPDIDMGLFWDDSAGEIGLFSFGSGLTMTGTTLTVDAETTWARSAPIVSTVTTTDTVSIGTTSGGGKLYVYGTADAIQGLFQGYAAQANPCLTVQDSTGTDSFTIGCTSSVGITIPGTTGIFDIGGAGVRLSDDGDGALTFTGLGDGNDENIILNLDDTSNVGTVTSSTSLATINFSSIGLQESGVNVPSTIDQCFTIESPVVGDDNVPVWSPLTAITVTGVYCRTEGGTSAGITISDGTNALEEVVCDATGEADDGTIANGTFTANERMEYDTGTVTGSVTWLNVCVRYKET